MFGRSRRAEIKGEGRGAYWAATGNPICFDPARKPGPPAVALARQIYAERDDVTFAPLETAFRGDGADLLVRAWVRIPADQIPPAVAASVDAVAGAFASDPFLQKVFFLSVSYRLSVDETAYQLGLGRRRVRALLRRAIARLDGTGRARASVAR